MFNEGADTLMPSNASPLVSVGLTSYQQPEGLRKILQCVTSQTYENLDIVVSDNCSFMAEVEDVLGEFESRDRRIRVFRQASNIGMEPNHTFVLRQSKGEFFLWLHGGDDIPQNYIERCLARFADSPDIVLVGPMGDRYMEERYWYSYRTYSNIGVNVYERLSQLIPVAYYGPSFFEQYFYGVFKRDALSECIWEDNKSYYKETFSMFFRLSERGYLHVAEDVTLTKYNAREDLSKWRNAKYVDRPLRYKFAGSRVEELIPRTLNIFSTVIKSKQLTASQKFRLIVSCFPCFAGALNTGQKPLWKRMAQLPRRLLRKTRYMLRRVLETLLRYLT
jgi:glycosyltransferase involved in cell wall biosynthesis